MPQVDKFTFYTIVFWTFFVYVLGYLLVSAIVFYGFLTKIKLLISKFDFKLFVSVFFSSALFSLSFFSLVLI